MDAKISLETLREIIAQDVMAASTEYFDLFNIPFGGFEERYNELKFDLPPTFAYRQAVLEYIDRKLAEMDREE